jgi:uncharacterized protein (DUF305 family)
LRTSRRNLLRAGSIATILAMAGCDDGSAAGSAAVTAPAPALSAGQAGFFGGTDLAWVEINIAMDEQLLPLLALVPGKAAGADVKAYAAGVESFTNAELATLRKLHDQAKLPAENPHEGMPMPGMVTPEQVTEAGAASGAAFDRLLVKRVRAHLEQGTSLATSEEKAGVEPQTLALARQVLTTRATAIRQAGTLSAA